MPECPNLAAPRRYTYPGRPIDERRAYDNVRYFIANDRLLGGDRVGGGFDSDRRCAGLFLEGIAGRFHEGSCQGWRGR